MNDRVFIVICILIVCIILYIAICINDYIHKKNRLQNRKKQNINSTKETKINHEINNDLKNVIIISNSLLSDNENDVNTILPETTNPDPIQLIDDTKIEIGVENDEFKITEKVKKVSSKKPKKKTKYINIRFVDSDEIHTFLAPYKCELRKGDYCLIEYNDLEQQVIAVSDIYYEKLDKNKKHDYLKIIKYLDEQELKTNNRIIHSESNLNFPYGKTYKVRKNETKVMPRGVVLQFLELVHRLYYESPLLVNEFSDYSKFASAIKLATSKFAYPVTMKDIIYHFGPYCIRNIYNLDLLVKHSVYVYLSKDKNEIIEYDECINKSNGKKGMILLKKYNSILKKYIFTFKEMDGSSKCYDLLEDNLELISHQLS